MDLFLQKKTTKNFSFDGFGGPPDECLLQHFPKPTNNSWIWNQNNNTRLCETYGIYFFYPIERMDYYGAGLKKFLLK